MHRIDLINNMQTRLPHLPAGLVTVLVKELLVLFMKSISAVERIEIRGFGTFSVRRYEARISRNPKTSVQVEVPAKGRIYFKPGKELRDRVNNATTR